MGAGFQNDAIDERYRAILRYFDYHDDKEMDLQKLREVLAIFNPVWEQVPKAMRAQGVQLIPEIARWAVIHQALPHQCDLHEIFSVLIPSDDWMRSTPELYLAAWQVTLVNMFPTTRAIPSLSGLITAWEDMPKDQLAADERYHLFSAAYEYGAIYSQYVDEIEKG